MSHSAKLSAAVVCAAIVAVWSLAGCKPSETIVYVEVTPVPVATEVAEPPGGETVEHTSEAVAPQPVERLPRATTPTRIPPTMTPVPPTATPTATHTPTTTPTPTPIPVTVAQGTLMDVEFLQKLSSHESEVGQAFSVRIVEPVRVGGRIAIPAGAIISGTVTEAKPAKKVGGRSTLSLDFDLLELPSGHSYPVTVVFSQKGKSSTGRDVAIIGGATVGGAIVGHQVDGDKGTEIGAVVGAIAGAVAASQTRAKPVEIQPGTVMTLEVTDPLHVEIIQ